MMTMTCMQSYVTLTIVVKSQLTVRFDTNQTTNQQSGRAIRKFRGPKQAQQTSSFNRAKSQTNRGIYTNQSKSSPDIESFITRFVQFSDVTDCMPGRQTIHVDHIVPHPHT